MGTTDMSEDVVRCGCVLTHQNPHSRVQTHQVLQCVNMTEALAASVQKSRARQQRYRHW